MSHTCHAHGCVAEIPPKYFMCYGHWQALEPRLQAAVWREYRKGQEIDKDPSLRYLAVQQHAIGAVVFKPNDEPAALLAAPYLVRSLLYRRAAIRAGDGDPLPWIQLPPDDLEGVQG